MQFKKKSSGKLILISGPSGAGKTTLRKLLLNDFKDIIKFSISYTTRPKRADEVNGKDYFFVSEKEFKNMISNNEFIEFAIVYNHYYGTSKKYVDKLLKSGYHVLLELDVQGGKNVINLYNELLTIFILPPSIEELKLRLKKRGSETENSYKIRVKKAIEEIKEKIHYKYWIVNDNLNNAYKLLKTIIKNYIKN